MTDAPTPEPMRRITSIRSIIANMLMAFFVLSTSVGAAMLWSIGAGLMCLGLTAAVVGYLLGAE